MNIIFKLIITSFLTLMLISCNSGSNSNLSGGIFASQVTTPSGARSANYGVYYTGANPGSYLLYVPNGNGSNYSISTTPVIDSTITNSYITNLLNGGDIVITTPTSDVWTVGFYESGNSFGPTLNYESTSFAHESLSIQTLFLIVESVNAVPYLINGSYDGTYYMPFLAKLGSSSGAESIHSYESLCVSLGSNANDAQEKISAIAEPNLAYNPFVVFGNNAGDVCSYNIITQVWRNFTKGSTTYRFGSKILSISIGYTINTGLYYNYFVTESGQIWVATVNLTGDVTEVTQLNKASGPLVIAGRTTAIYADLNNNLYVGEANGYIYGLANGSTTWQNIQLKANSGILETGAVSAIVPTTGESSTENGLNYPQVIMANGHVYNLGGL